MAYDYQALSPGDFEDLTRDLLKAELKLFIQSFKSGSDGGIDLRYTSDKKNYTIIQCKRYFNFQNLKKELKKETKRIFSFEYQRYIIFTTCPLSPQNHSEIKQLFVKKFDESKIIIYGQNDLEGLLNKHKKVRDLYFKLWIKNGDILSRFLNKDIQLSSEITLEKIYESARMYVNNKSLDFALNKIKEHRCVIISGNPGVGKSTLARFISLIYLNKGYNLINVSDNIKDAFKMYLKDEKQVFIYDDFLGSNFLNSKLEKKEEQQIVGFINLVSKDQRKVLIFTTRQYILNQANNYYEIFRRENINLKKMIIDTSKYTNKIRAKIFCQHLFHNKVNQSYIKSLINSRIFYSIVFHKNYTPRIIEIATKKEFFKGLGYNDYPDKVLAMLNNPEEIWSHAFLQQIRASSRELLFCLLICGGSAEYENIKKFWASVCSSCLNSFPIIYEDQEFKECIRELENSFISTHINNSSVIRLVFNNPSISDYLNSLIISDFKILAERIKNAVHFENIISFDYFSFMRQNEKADSLGSIVDEYYTNWEEVVINNAFRIAGTSGYYKPEYFVDRAYRINFLRKMYIGDSSRLVNFLREETDKMFNTTDECEYAFDVSRLAVLVQDIYSNTNPPNDSVIEYCVKNICDLEDIQKVADLESFITKKDKTYNKFRSSCYNTINRYVKQCNANEARETAELLQEIKNNLDLDLDEEIRSLEAQAEEYEKRIAERWDEDVDEDDYKMSGRNSSSNAHEAAEIKQMFQALIDPY